MSRDPHEPDDDLRRLLADAVDDLEPADGLATIRSRTHEKVTPMSNRRPWLYAVTGAVVATAAVIAAVAVAGGTLSGDADPSPAAGPTSAGASQEPTGDPTQDPTAEPTADTDPPGEGGTSVVPAYYLGEGARGPVLFREFHRVQQGGSGTAARGAAQEAVSGTPLDPDYRTAWPAGVTVEDVVVDGDVVRVELSEAPARGGLSEREADLAVQQVVWSVQGALQQRAPVQFTVDGQPVAEVLGVATSEPVANAPLLETLSLMSITFPEEGASVPDQLVAEGVSNGFEANVVWQVLDAEGTVVADGFGTAEGWMEERLFPWSVQVDLSDLAPGEYTFLARTDDPSGGTEGDGPASDDRTIVVE